MAGTGDGEAGIWYTGGTAFLSSTEDKSNPYGWMPFVFDFYDGKPEFTSMNGNIIGYSVRCLKNSANVTEEAYSPQGKETLYEKKFFIVVFLLFVLLF